jgi:glycine betaine/proline transport system substrate-binding protein
VTLTNLAPGLIYGGVKDDSKGDVFLDAWLPDTHKDYPGRTMVKKLVVLGEAFSEILPTGLVVFCLCNN